MTIRIGFIGYGEVGTTFGADLVRNGASRVAAFDLLFADPPRGGALQERARAAGVVPVASAAAAVDGADVVISAVTADVTEAVAMGLAPLLPWQCEHLLLKLDLASAIVSPLSATSHSRCFGLSLTFMKPVFAGVTVDCA